MLIIFGSRTVSSRISTGEFDCPYCGEPRYYEYRRGQRFFHIFWIPLIPIAKETYYVQCMTCKNQYDSSILQKQAALKSAETPPENAGTVETSTNSATTASTATTSTSSGFVMPTVSPYAGIGGRIGAFILDTIITMIIWTISATIISAATGGQLKQEENPMANALLLSLMLLIPLLYATILEGSGMAGTLGKKAVGAKVVRTDGGALGIPRALLRNLVKIATWFLPLLYFVAAAGSKKQAIHDMVAGSVVLKKNATIEDQEPA